MSIKSLAEWQQEIRKIGKEKGWTTKLFEKYFLFQEEIGELTKAIRNDTGFHLEIRENDKTEHENREELVKEFADVQLYLMDLANHFGVDLEAALRYKTGINQNREWS